MGRLLTEPFTPTSLSYYTLKYIMIALIKAVTPFLISKPKYNTDHCFILPGYELIERMTRYSGPRSYYFIEMMASDLFQYKMSNHVRGQDSRYEKIYHSVKETKRVFEPIKLDIYKGKLLILDGGHRLQVAYDLLVMKNIDVNLSVTFA